MDFRDKQWKYINEGNVHIVLQIMNTDYVLRLVKEDGNALNLEAIQDAIKFVNCVMVPLICDSSHYKEELVEISGESVTYLSEKLLELRPKHRINKSVISKFAIKAPNLTMISQSKVNYTLEIKAKEGFKSASASFSNIPKCYYCLKQILKLQEKQINMASDYCPLSLFSGDRKRMKTALYNLLCNPQNNFKMFKDGHIIYNEQSNILKFNELIKSMGMFTSTSLFLDFVISILLSNTTLYPEINGSELEPKGSKCVEGTQLESNTFLYKLLSLQKLSENLTIDVQDVGGKYDYVSTVLQELELENLQVDLECDRKKFLENTDPLHLWLISAIAKDCSVMISFSTEFLHELPSIQVGDKAISYRVSVTDLEPKSAATWAKRKTTESKLIAAYHKYVGSTEWVQCKYLVIYLQQYNKNVRIQPHSETRSKQLEAWHQLIAEYMKATKQSTIDIRESQNGPLFNNASINRKLSQESVLTILEDMAKTGNAAPIDKSKNVWEIYWHSLDEWGNMVYSWACSNGLNNTVCTLFELKEGENTVGEEFHGLDMNVLIKALKSLEVKGKCELIQFDDNQGVKFF